MRFAWLAVVVLFSGCQETHTFQWTQALQDGADVYACLGDSATFPWSYSLLRGEKVEDIKWYYHHGSSSQESVAGTVDGRFFSLSAKFSDRIGHVQEAGISLTSLTSLDRGRYSVAVTVLQGSSFSVYNHTATLIIAEDPLVLENEALWARQERVAVYDNTTGQLHVRLSCGRYVITGHPPVSVEWTFPSGEKQLIATHTNGTFFLTLPNPVEGGNYTCRLFPKLPPVSCIPNNASVLRNSSVSVDEVKMRLSLVEAEQEIIKTEKQTLRAELKEDNRKLGENLQHVRSYITERDSNKVRFFARPTTADGSSQPNRPIIFSNVTMNEGHSYNETTGIFTAPFNGTYVFFLALHQPNNYVDIRLSDGVNTFCRATANSNTKTTCDATVYRSRGEQVWSYFVFNYQVTFSPDYSSFIGFSLDADIQADM